MPISRRRIEFATTQLVQGSMPNRNSAATLPVFTHDTADLPSIVEIRGVSAGYRFRFSPGREWLAITLLLLLIKAVFLLWDPQLRVFMGDSESYLQAAMTSWNPPDRSITYPLLVTVAVWAQSGIVLVILQSGLGVLSSLGVFWILRRSARVSMIWAALASALVALEPTQLFYERMVMAEAAGFFAFTMMLVSAIAYVESGKLRWAWGFLISAIRQPDRKGWRGAPFLSSVWRG